MVNIKKGDFIEIEYTGRTKEGIVFDTTYEDVAKKNKIHNKDASYGPIVICIGQNHILSGLDKRIQGKNLGEYDFELTIEEGFGKKTAKLLRLIPMSAFRKQDIQPVPGLQFNIDGINGVVKTVSGGRVIIDFNHPLAGKELVYHVKINKLVEELNEKIKALIKIQFGLKDNDFNIKIENDIVEIKLNKKINIPPEIEKLFKDNAIELTKVKDINIVK